VKTRGLLKESIPQPFAYEGRALPLGSSGRLPVESPKGSKTSVWGRGSALLCMATLALQIRRHPIMDRSTDALVALNQDGQYNRGLLKPRVADSVMLLRKTPVVPRAEQQCPSQSPSARFIGPTPWIIASGVPKGSPEIIQEEISLSGDVPLRAFFQPYTQGRQVRFMTIIQYHGRDGEAYNCESSNRTYLFWRNLK